MLNYLNKGRNLTKVKGIGQIDEVQRWKEFVDENQTYDLSHLDAHFVKYDFQAGNRNRQYEVTVSYSFHCFAKAQDHHSEHEKEVLMYHAPRESRPFHHDRYNLSFGIRKEIEDLDKITNAVIGHAGHDNYAVVNIKNYKNQDVQYKITFRVFKERKKLRMHITSAYHKKEPDIIRKVKFEAVLDSALRGKPAPKPRR
jgi:hypothetical protein